ncbi:transmembrane protein, putative [Medicago truncatula]|uniref:Transmembrane protein, putative n=1 Tax=Medicago truncatula TaxID=3880 RepID=A0A072TNQ9_MEDTR|nr:transmembrane protein, putative [Medicago truncatula]
MCHKVIDNRATPEVPHMCHNFIGEYLLLGSIVVYENDLTCVCFLINSPTHTFQYCLLWFSTLISALNITTFLGKNSNFNSSYDGLAPSIGRNPSWTFA